MRRSYANNIISLGPSIDGGHGGSVVAPRDNLWVERISMPMTS